MSFTLGISDSNDAHTVVVLTRTQIVALLDLLTILNSLGWMEKELEEVIITNTSSLEWEAHRYPAKLDLNSEPYANFSMTVIESVQMRPTSDST